MTHSDPIRFDMIFIATVILSDTKRRFSEEFVILGSHNFVFVSKTSYSATGSSSDAKNLTLLLASYLTSTPDD